MSIFGKIIEVDLSAQKIDQKILSEQTIRRSLIRQGGSIGQDSLPELFLQSPITKGPIRGRKVNLKPMIEEFYECMGWDESGRPTAKILQRFNLKI